MKKANNRLGPIAPETAMEELAIALLLWISKHTDYSMEDIVPPVITLMSPQQITAEYYSSAPHLIPLNGTDSRILALYDSQTLENGTVYLNVPWSERRSSTAIDALIEDPLFQERLLHELVHHVQYQSGQVASYPCQAIGEKEAYRLGGVFLKQRYIEDPMPNRNFWAHVYSRC